MDDAEKASIFKNDIYEGKHLINSDFDASLFQTIEALTCKNDFYVTQTAHSYNKKITAEEIP